MLVFDTLGYSEKLQNVGFTPQQAKVQAETIREILDTNLATKQDLKEMELILRRELSESKMESIKWIAGMLLVQSGILIGGFFAIVRFLISG